MNPFRKLALLGYLLVGGCSIGLGADVFTNANRLTYLDSDDPFYVGKDFPKLVTPQWVGEPGVDAVVTLAIDDMADSAKYEKFLRPILNRLKEIDGRAPVSIMTMSAKSQDGQVQAWLKEGLSLEVHTLAHPCPLCEKGSLETAIHNVHGCIDVMNQFPGNHPVAFRMPCCDSMDSASPRFFAEIFNCPTREGHFLTLDSSVFTITTTNDPGLARELTVDADGRPRFWKYLPKETNTLTKVGMKAYVANVEDYPYPYLIGKLCWEFPCMVPSDWEAFNLHGSTNAITVADWKAALDAVVIKKGVFNMVFHPHGWIRNEQVVEFINYAVSKYGKKVKFLTFREAEERLNSFMLAGQSVRDAKSGEDNGVRLMDLNNDGYQDVIIANEQVRKTRIWDPKSNQWMDTEFPVSLVNVDKDGIHHDAGVKFGIVLEDGFPTAFFRNEKDSGAWHFDGRQWAKDDGFFNGLELEHQPVLTIADGRDRGVRLRDVDKSGQCALLVGNEKQNGVFKWSKEARSWKPAEFSLPKDTAFVDATGRDLGLRFADINQDGFDDIIYSNEKNYSVNLFINTPKPHLGFDKGWSFTIQSGERGDTNAIPMIVRGGTNNNNGAWFRFNTLWVQNEDTATLPDKVDRRSFAELLTGPEPRAKSPEQSLASIRVADGFTVELVACEPLVIDPVAFDWGADGKLWVVEMRDYPLGVDGKGKSGGMIKFLEDTDGDGRYDKATVFMENVHFPNGIMPWGKGVLISAAPEIFYAEDTDGDGKADVRRVLFTGFNEGNQQHRINGFEYGLDNRVYAANGGSNGKIKSLLTGQAANIRFHDLSFLPDEASFRLEPGQTQFGRHRDDWGNWFGNENPTWLWHYYLQDRYLARNSYLAATSNRKVLADYAEQNRVYTIAHLQKRFNWVDAVYQTTSANSATPYRDELFGEAFATSVFVSEPANNVVHREVLEPDGVSFSSHRGKGEEVKEFLASTDNWCRPTMLKTGPDGALYIADMYRLVIEHPEYFPEELKNRPDLRAGDDKGRIYRVYPKGAKLRKVPTLDHLSTPDLVAAMESPNGWQRDTVQRLLVEKKDTAAVKPLLSLFKKSEHPKTRLQALCTLDGLGALTPEVLVKALQDKHPAVRENAIRIAEPMLNKSAQVGEAVLKLLDDPETRVRYQLAFSLGEWKSERAGETLGKLALKENENVDMQTALLSSALPHLDGMLGAILSGLPKRSPSPGLMEQLTKLAVIEGRTTAVTRAFSAMEKERSEANLNWRLATLLGFWEGLDSKNVTWKEYAAKAGAEVQPVLKIVQAAFKQVPGIVADPKAQLADRQTAVRLLGRGVVSTDETAEALVKLLAPDVKIELQQAALETIEHVDSARVGEKLLMGWNGYAPEMRATVMNMLFSRPERTKALMQALEAGIIPTSQVAIVHRQQLLNHSDAGIRERATKLFAASNADRQKVVAAYQEVSTLTGRIEHGAELFRANCALCHKLKGEGNAVGPDLSTVSDKPASELITSILDPSRTIEATFIAYNVITKDGRELTGVIAAETPNSITLRMPGSPEEVILRKDLEKLTGNTLSLMPEGFEAVIKPQDMADLIAYITSAAPLKAAK